MKRGPKNFQGFSLRAVVACCLVTALGVSALVGAILTPRSGTAPNSLEADSREFPYLSKRIFVDNPNDILINLIDLRLYLEKYVDSVSDNDKNLGLYFEYLPSGTSIGINENFRFASASLMKLPVAMAIYKGIETGHLGFDTVLTVAPEQVNLETGSLGKKGAGTRVTVDDAVRLSLIESDNTANQILADQLPTGVLQHVFESLDLPIVTKGIEVLTTPRNYSSILRSLYLSSYLQKNYSNRLLSLLSRAEFLTGIRGGVPPAVPVAHKYGVYYHDMQTPNPASDQIIMAFSDCGIVYLPKRPYMLCVMTRHFTPEQAERHMNHVSQAIYQYVVGAKGND